MASALTLKSDRFTGKLTAALVLAGLSLAAAAQTTWSTQPQTDTSQQGIAARYESDKKLCTAEASPEARLQCRRDAQAVYDRALAANRPGQLYSTQSTPQVCSTCGRVTAVNVTEKAGESNAVGMIAGGVAGAVLGHQVGGGLGKDLATIAGAAGGAYAGKVIQENMSASKVWRVSVQYPDGQTASFDFAQDPGFKAGDAVRNSGNTVIRNSSQH